MSARPLELSADLTSHHLEGIAREGHTPFKVGLVSQVGVGDVTVRAVPAFSNGAELWHGGCIDGADGSYFDVIVSLYPWERYAIAESTVRVETALFDSRDGVDVERIEQMSDFVAASIKRGKKVLVHCQAGLNRSSLVVADYLIRHALMTPADAVKLIREQRCDACLCNPSFERWVLER